MQLLSLIHQAEGREPRGNRVRHAEGVIGGRDRNDARAGGVGCRAAARDGAGQAGERQSANASRRTLMTVLSVQDRWSRTIPDMRRNSSRFDLGYSRPI